MRITQVIVLITTLLLSVTTLAANPQVIVKTNMGNITLELYPDKAPNTVQNFLQYAEDGFYKNTIFHRVIRNFMIQGGGFDTTMQQKTPRAPIENEAANGLKNQIGTVAMARTSAPHSATAQFFINVADNAFLNYTASNQRGFGYTVFGKVTDGIEVVNKIAAIPTGSGGPFRSDVPRESVIIEDVVLLPID